MFFIFCIILIISFVIWHQIKYRRRDELLSRIPSPKKYPLIHNVPEFFGKNRQGLFETIETLSISLGQVYHITINPFDAGSLIVSDPKVVEGILSSQKLIDKSEDYDLMKAWLGTGLLISTGKKWFQRRKILTPSFHFQILEKFVEIMEENGNVLIKKLEKLNGQEVNIFPIVNLYALDVICESAMGCKMNAQNQDSAYVRAVKEISEIIYERAFDAIRRHQFIYQFTEMFRREKNCLKILHGFTDGVIKGRREELLSQDITRKSVESSEIKRKMALLDLLLQATIDGAPLTNSDIREEVDTFMFEGHDTTTSGISFCLYNIAKHPKVQQKVFEEIQSEVGDGAFSLQVLNKLHYLDLVIKESLRLYPSVPYFARQMAEEVTVGGYTIPKHTNVTIAPYLMGRDPKTFSNPLVFDPSRFEVETTTEKVNPFAYIPFSAGPRNCIGQKFAVYELKSIIGKIVRDFELSLTRDNLSIKVYGDLVLKPMDGVFLNINKRE